MRLIRRKDTLGQKETRCIRGSKEEIDGLLFDAYGRKSDGTRSGKRRNRNEESHGQRTDLFSMAFWNEMACIYPETEVGYVSVDPYQEVVWVLGKDVCYFSFSRIE